MNEERQGILILLSIGVVSVASFWVASVNWDRVTYEGALYWTGLRGDDTARDYRESSPERQIHFLIYRLMYDVQVVDWLEFFDVLPNMSWQTIPSLDVHHEEKIRDCVEERISTSKDYMVLRVIAMDCGTPVFIEAAKTR